MLGAGQRIVFSPRDAPYVRRYGVFVCKWRNGYVKVIFDGETDEKLFPESEVTGASLLETIAWEVAKAEEADEAAREQDDPQ